MPSVLLTTLNAKYIHTNLAIRLLYQLNKHRHGLCWKEFTIKEDRNKIAELCAEFDVVAFSCYIWNITPTLEVCRLIKTISPQTRILLGGPEVSYDYNDVISRPEVDYIIAGEGERAFEAFLDTYPDIEHVPNFVFKKADVIQSNPAAPLFDLNRLEAIMPYADDDLDALKTKVLYMETSRGCPYKCEFCLASLDNKVRYLPIASIKSTLLHMLQHGKVIKFLDRTFNIKRDFTLDIFEFILTHHRPGNVFQFEITADILHPDIIRFIRERVPKGLFRFEIGIQTVNQQANLAVSRKQNFEKTKGIIQQLDAYVEMHLDLIVGLPLDRMNDIRHSFEQVFTLHAAELQLGFLKFLKGTPVRDKHQEHGYVFDPMPPYELLSSNYLSASELKQIKALEHALEIYWNGAKAVNTLKYVSRRYNIFDFLMKTGQTFIQAFGSGQYNTEQLYQHLMNTAVAEFEDDWVVRELIAIDYYLHYKLMPAPIAGVRLPLKTNVDGARIVSLTVGFDFETFGLTGEITPGAYTLNIFYDSVNSGRFKQEQHIVPSITA